jgi:hypothetical protein
LLVKLGAAGDPVAIQDQNGVRLNGEINLDCRAGFVELSRVELRHVSTS